MAARGLPACGFLVSATKGGSVPVAVEKRAKGKKVTVISNVQGNARALCTSLTTLLGVGGTTHERGPKAYDVEVQGEQVDRVTAALGQLGCLRGLPRSRETATTVIERDAAHDAFLVGAPRERKARHEKPAIVLEPPPENAPCKKWHGDWMYCRGCCEEPDPNDVWDLRSELAPELRAARPVRSSRSSPLEASLRCLGMLAEQGDAVRDWIATRLLLEQEALRKQVAPQPSLCAAPRVAPSDTKFLCKECGASFSLAKTLKRHMQQHQEERRGAAQAQPVNAVSAGYMATEDTSWRRSTYEEEAVYAAEEEAWDDWPEAIDDTEEYRAPQNAASLSSWISVAVGSRGSRAKPKRSRQKPEIATGPSVACPICGGRFPSAEIERHVDVCLTVQQPVGNASSVTANSGASDDADAELPQELLESLLHLDLSVETATRFWERFERATARGSGGSVQDRFIAALEATLSEELFEDDDDDRAARSAMPSEPLAQSAAEVEAESADFCQVKSRRARRWDASSRNDSVQHHQAGIAAQEPTAAKASSRSAERGAAKAPPARARNNKQAKAAEKAEIAPKTEQERPDTAQPQKVAQHEAQPIGVWLREALSPLLAVDEVEAVLAGVEVVLSCSDDAEAADNASDLLAAELPAGSELGDAVLSEFKRRLAVVVRQ